MNNKGKTVQASETERAAINDREQVELARRIQLSADQERRMKALATGGRRLLMFNAVLGTQQQPQQQQPVATMGVRS